jgi:hypothetical protein
MQPLVCCMTFNSFYINFSLKQMVENGQMRRIQHRWLPLTIHCEDNELRSPGMDKVFIVFITLYSIYFLCFIMCLVEYVIKVTLSSNKS